MNGGVPREHESAHAATEEGRLWGRLLEGSEDAREALFEIYKPFARALAARHYHRSAGDVDIDDLRQLAYTGLLEALGRYDPARGVPFRGYAARRIAGSILDGINRMSDLREQIAYRRRVRQERLRSLSTAPAGRPRSSAEAMRELADLATGLALGFMLETGMVVGADQADERPNAYQGLAWRQTVRKLLAEVVMLPPRERRVIEEHYLQGRDFHHIATALGVSKGRVSQIHKAAIGRLRAVMTALEITL